MNKQVILRLAAGLLLLSLLATACAPNGDAASLAGTSWKLVSYGSASAPQPAAPDVETNLAFGSDGKLNGSMGCNGFSGNYSVQGEKITFGPITATLMACPDPQMAQEGAAFQVLKDTANFKLDGSTLTITSADGNTALMFTAATGK